MNTKTALDISRSAVGVRKTATILHRQITVPTAKVSSHSPWNLITADGVWQVRGSADDSAFKI